MEILYFYLTGVLTLSIYNCYLIFSGSLDDLTEDFSSRFILVLGILILPLLWPFVVLGHVLGRLFGIKSEP